LVKLQFLIIIIIIIIIGEVCGGLGGAKPPKRCDKEVIKSAKR